MTLSKVAITAIFFLGTLTSAFSQSPKTQNFAANLGLIISAESFCGFYYDQEAIKKYTLKNVSPNDLNFPADLDYEIFSSQRSQKKMSESAKSAYCTQINRLAKKYKFIAALKPLITAPPMLVGINIAADKFDLAMRTAANNLGYVDFEISKGDCSIEESKSRLCGYLLFKKVLLGAVGKKNRSDTWHVQLRFNQQSTKQQIDQSTDILISAVAPSLTNLEIEEIRQNTVSALAKQDKATFKKGKYQYEAKLTNSSKFEFNIEPKNLKKIIANYINRFAYESVEFIFTNDAILEVVCGELYRKTAKYGSKVTRTETQRLSEQKKRVTVDGKIKAKNKKWFTVRGTCDLLENGEIVDFVLSHDTGNKRPYKKSKLRGISGHLWGLVIKNMPPSKDGGRR